MAVWTLTIQEIINFFSALTGAKVSADVSELVKDLHINRNEETYPYLAPVGLGSTLIQLVRGFPATTGGQKLAALFQSITTDGTDYTAIDAGVITQIPAKDFAFSLLNALGVSVTALSDVVWTSVCNALSNIYGKEVTADNITDFMVLAVVQNGSLMFDEATIKAFSDALYEEAFFATGKYAARDTITTGYNNLSAYDVTGENFINFVSLFSSASSPSVASFNMAVATALSASGIFNHINDLFYDRYGVNANFLHITNSDYNSYIGLTFHLNYVNEPSYKYVGYSGGEYYIQDERNVLTLTGIKVNYTGTTITSVEWDDANIVYTTTSNREYLYYTTQWSAKTFKQLSTLGIHLEGKDPIENTIVQTGATLPSANLDLSTEYATWYSTGVNAGYWDDSASLLRTRKMIPIALQGDDTEVYTVPQVQAWNGDVDDTTDKTKDKIVDGATRVLDVPTDWVDEGTRTIPLDVPTSPEPMNTDTPPVVLPSGTAGGPVTVYNPTQAQMDSLRTELWNNGLVTSIQTLFNANPMDAIISCHMIYASPHVDATKKGLYLGNVFMNVSGVNVVDEQFIEVDCGTVSVPELFGNATDYEPYTSVEIYLPFIGIQQLSANDVVGGSVSLVMKQDVLTGAILAEITVTKNGSTQTLYQFTGNGAVQIPLTGQDRLSQIMGGIKGALSGGFTGGVAGAVMGAASGAIASKPSIMKSGGFSPNTGAMAGKLPYLIINRNVPLDASEYNKFTGYPSNKKVNLGSVNGFTRVKDVHVEGIICTEQEKTLIEEALKEGIFL